VSGSKAMRPPVITTATIHDDVRLIERFPKSARTSRA
jgi:hypothetical protein